MSFKQKLLTLIGVLGFTSLALFANPNFGNALPYYSQTQSMLPGVTDKYYIGTSSPSTLEYLGLFVKDITISGTCTGCSSGSSFSWVTQSYGVSTSTTLGFLAGFLSTASSTVKDLHISGLSNGILGIGAESVYSIASSSIFGFTPASNATTITVAGTANQVSSSAGAQDLSANRTWTLSLPNHVIFPNSFFSSLASTTNATTTNFHITSLLTKALATDNNGKVYGYATTTAGTGLTYDGTSFNNSGVLSNIAGAGITVSGATGNVTISAINSAFPYVSATTYGTTTQSTSTPPWFRGSQYSLFASSTAVFTNASSTQFTVGNIFASGNTLLTTAGSAFNITSDGGITLDAGGSASILLGPAGGDAGVDINGSGNFRARASTGRYAVFDVSSVATSDKTFTFPNVSGTVALGTGTANQVSYWSGTNTLTSEAAFTYVGTNSQDLLTFANASSTNFTNATYANFAGKLGIASTSPAFPFSVNNAGSDFYIDSTGKLVGRDTANSWAGRITPTKNLGLQTGTTTTWTATSSGAYSPFVIAPFAGTIQAVRCATDASFLGVQTQIAGSNLAPAYFVASTTVGKIAFTGSNTFTTGQKISANFGTTTTSSATTISCTYDITETP